MRSTRPGPSADVGEPGRPSAESGRPASQGPPDGVTVPREATAPAPGQPAAGQPGGGQRAAGQPGGGRSAAGQRGGGQPGGDRLVADRSGGGRRRGRAVIAVTALLVVALIAGISIGPASMPLSAIVGSLAGHLPWHPAVAVPPIDSAIIWQLRMPRVVLGALVGSMLAGGGAAYQGVFRNPLADPYLLGVAAGAGLGATAVIISGASPTLLPVAAFGGAAGAVALTYSLGAGAGRAGEETGPHRPVGTASILLAGVAVAALLTAAQTYLQQSHAQTLQAIYSWILGGLSGATWSQVALIIPYVLVSAVTLLAHRRLLDVLRVGESEAGTLGVNVARLRLVVVIAATLGAAAAVSVSGLIGFVGIIVPHVVRLIAGPSYRVVLPVSMIGGAAFLVLADIAARTVQADTEVPIGVITAAVGAPFFLFVLRSRRARADMS